MMGLVDLEAHIPAKMALGTQFDDYAHVTLIVTRECRNPVAGGGTRKPSPNSLHGSLFNVNDPVGGVSYLAFQTRTLEPHKLLAAQKGCLRFTYLPHLFLPDHACKDPTCL